MRFELTKDFLEQLRRAIQTEDAVWIDYDKLKLIQNEKVFLCFLYKLKLYLKLTQEYLK